VCSGSMRSCCDTTALDNQPPRSCKQLPSKHLPTRCAWRGVACNAFGRQAERPPEPIRPRGSPPKVSVLEVRTHCPPPNFWVFADGAGVAAGLAGGGAGGLTGPAACGLFACKSAKTRSIARLIGIPTTPLLLSIQ